MDNQQDNHVAESVKNAPISAVQRIINNRLANSENTNEVSIDSENTNEVSTSQVDMIDDVSNTTEQSEMLDSQNVSGESEHDSNDVSLSTYEKAKETFLKEKVVPYYESPSDDQVVEMGTKLDTLKGNLDGLAGHDTKNNSSWNEYFEELGNLNPGSISDRVDGDCVSTDIATKAKNVGSTMQSTLESGIEGVEKTIGDMAKGIDEKTNGALSNVIQSGQNAFSNVGQTIGELANNVSSPVQNVFNGVIQSGQNIANQFQNTINDMSKSTETNTVSYNEQDDNDQSILESKFASSKYC